MRQPTGLQGKPKAYLSPAATPWAMDAQFPIQGDYCPQASPKADNDPIIC